MDNIQEYMAEVRQIEATIQEEYPLIMSLKNRKPESHPGVLTQVTRFVAAKHICDKTARLATAEEASEFWAEQKRVAKEASAKSEAKAAIRTLLSEADTATAAPAPAAPPEKPAKK